MALETLVVVQRCRVSLLGQALQLVQDCHGPQLAHALAAKLDVIQAFAKTPGGLGCLVKGLALGLALGLGLGVALGHATGLALGFGLGLGLGLAKPLASAQTWGQPWVPWITHPHFPGLAPRPVEQHIQHICAIKDSKASAQVEHNMMPTPA